MISLKISICVSVALLFASCTDRSDKNPANDSSNSSALDVAALVASQMQGGQELASFLDQGEKVKAIDVLDGASHEPAVANRFEEQKKSVQPIAIFSKEADLEPDEFEKVLQVSHPGGSFEITLNELRADIVRKDQSIASLTRLNEELIAEIQRLRGNTPSNLNLNYKTKSFSDSNLENLQKEIAVLKKNLLQNLRKLMVLNFEMISSKMELIPSNLGWLLKVMKHLLFLVILVSQAMKQPVHPPLRFSFQTNHAVWSLMLS